MSIVLLIAFRYLKRFTGLPLVKSDAVADESMQLGHVNTFIAGSLRKTKLRITLCFRIRAHSVQESNHIFYATTRTIVGCKRNNDVFSAHER